MAIVVDTSTISAVKARINRENQKKFKGLVSITPRVAFRSIMAQAGQKNAESRNRAVEAREMKRVARQLIKELK